MARTIPSPTSGRTIPAPAPSGGGGGGNPWKTWTELPLDPSEGWTIVNGTGATSKSATATKVGDQLHVEFPTTAGSSIQVSQSVNKGLSLIRSAHIQAWAEDSLERPDAAAAANYFWPEAFLLKLEVQFDEDKPITGPKNDETGNQYGRYMQCGIGIVRYSSDQSGNPGAPPVDGWDTAVVYKSGANDPEVSTATNEFFAGYNGYNGRGAVNGAKWRCQPDAASNGHDALVYSVGIPVGGENWNGQMAATGGSYATQNPYARVFWSGWTHQSNSTKYTGNQFFHIMLNFGAFNGTTSRCGTIRIKRIRYLLQPLDGRTTPTRA